MRLALAQTNSVVGDIDGNAARVVERIEAARAENADLVLLPELMVTGYPAEDLLLRPGFVRAARRAVDEIARTTHGIVALVGAPLFEDGALYNACFVLADGEVRDVYRKHHLPNYGVFDEDRYFAPGDDPVLLDIAGVRVGLTICEDIWISGPPSSELGAAGAQLVANISASPFHVGKAREREEIVRRCAAENGTPVALCNMVGAQDELVFDGHSVVIAADGEVLARAAGFEEDLLVVDWPELRGSTRAGARRPRADAVRARARRARLRREERLRRRRRERVGRDRLGPRRSAVRRSARPGARARRHAARRSTPPRARAATLGALRSRSASTSGRSRSSRSSSRSPPRSRSRSPGATPT